MLYQNEEVSKPKGTWRCRPNSAKWRGDQATPYRDVEAGPPPYLAKPNYKLKTKQKGRTAGHLQAKIK